MRGRVEPARQNAGLILSASTGVDAPAHPTFPSTHGLNGAAVARKQPVVVQDVSKDARYLTTFGATKTEAIFPELLVACPTGRKFRA